MRAAGKTGAVCVLLGALGEVELGGLGWRLMILLLYLIFDRDFQQRH